MRILSTRTFSRWAKKKLTIRQLLDAVNNLMEGKSAIRLGKHLWKVRIARVGAGKSGGYRTVVVYVEDRCVVFVYGFGKNETDNIDLEELDHLKSVSKTIVALTAEQIQALIDQQELYELKEMP